MWRGIVLLIAVLLVALLLVAKVSQAQVTLGDPALQPFVTAPLPGIEARGPGSVPGHELAVGESAPGFMLQGSGGTRVRLDDLRGQWTLLVFTYNHRSLSSYKDIENDLRKAGVRLCGVNQDGVEMLTSFVTREQLPFVVLSDPTRQVSQAFGMYDRDIDEIQPGAVLLDPRGVVQATVHRRVLPPAELMKLAQRSAFGA